MGGRALAVPPSLPPTPPISTRTVEIAARREFKPFIQGDLSAMCGVYAVIHALKLALSDVGGLSDTGCNEMFGRSVEYLDRRGWLADALIDGLEPRRRNSLARHLAKLVSTTNFEVEFEQPEYRGWSIEHVFNWIEGSLAKGWAVLITLTGSLEHHTVVAGITPNRLNLHDSSGHQFVRRASCGIRTGRYRLPVSALLRVTVKRRT